MIVVKLQGGLGNQMFQYAFIRSLSLSTGVPFAIDIIELEGGEGITRRQYSMQVFNINPKILNKKEFNYFIFEKKHPILTKIKRKFGKFVPYIIRQAGDLSFLEIKSDIKGDIYFDGYFQSEKYFLKNSSIIRKEFTLKNSLSKDAREVVETADKVESVLIQVRRGDYATNIKTIANHGLTGMDFFESSIKYIKDRVNKEIELFIISDDIEWCKENFKLPYKIYFVSNPNIADYEEIIIMTHMKHLIISNSTFGWWGAWLNTNPNKIVIAPKQWFKNQKLKQEDVVPKSWIRI